MRRSVILITSGLVFLGVACGTGVELQKQTTETEICVYEQKFHKFSGKNDGPKALIACTPDTSRGLHD